MLAEERKNQILHKLSTSGQLLTADLVRDFNVSEDTIRRDLKELADALLLKKVHGGAVALTTVPYEYSSRKDLNLESKATMAQAVTKLVRDGMVIFIDGGTTCGQLPFYLPPNIRATFITHSIANALALNNLGKSRTIMLGGQVVPELLITTGPELTAQASRFKPDMSIISAHGVTVADGATVESWDDAMVKSTFVQNSAETVVLAGQEKIGFCASYLIAAVRDISYLISDAPKQKLNQFSKAGMTVWKV
ncbi:MAG TPA: DeoR/GlpR family DNA-binding transcription regulator [Chroococcales cyanobacterium]